MTNNDNLPAKSTSGEVLTTKEQSGSLIARGLAAIRPRKSPEAADTIDPKELLADAMTFYHRGSAYGHEQQWDLAIKEYDQAIRRNPHYVEALLRRAYAYGCKHQYDRAIEDYDQVIGLRPDSSFAFAFRGQAHAETGQHARAIQDFDQAIRLQPNWAAVFYDRGIALRALGQQARAAADFAKARKLDPSLPPPPE